MNKDKNWSVKCTLMGCTNPSLRPHHHHYGRGYLSVDTCVCPRVDQPGTKP